MELLIQLYSNLQGKNQFTNPHYHPHSLICNKIKFQQLKRQFQISMFQIQCHLN